MRTRYGLFIAVLIAPLFAAAFGCSSSSNESPVDGGLDTSAPPPDAGDSGLPDGDAALDAPVDPGDGGCVPVSLNGFTPRPFVPAPLHQGACSSAQVADYVHACGNQTFGASCGEWINTNVVADGGTACGNCVYPTLPDGGGSTAGANYEDPSNQVAWANYPACIHAQDPAHGTECATALDALYDCESFACVAACKHDPQGLAACETAADQGECATYFKAQAKACAYDPIYATGPVGGCYGGGSDDQDPALAFITTLICGNAADAPDAGPIDTDGGTDAGAICHGPGSEYPFPACFTSTCGSQIAACEQDCDCQATLTQCFANLFQAQTCVDLVAKGPPGLAATVSGCIYPLLVDYPTNCH